MLTPSARFCSFATSRRALVCLPSPSHRLRRRRHLVRSEPTLAPTGSLLHRLNDSSLASRCKVRIRPETAVHVIADGVCSATRRRSPSLSTSVHLSSLLDSSVLTCANALAGEQRLRAAGAQITTSESFIFQLQYDAGAPAFKAFSKAVKDVMPTTRDALRALAGDGGSVVESKL